MVLAKHCTKCGSDKLLTEFYRRSRSPDGLQSWCKECLRSYCDAVEETPEGRLTRKQINKRHRQRNPLFREQDATRARERRKSPIYKAKQRVQDIRKLYGLSEAAYNVLHTRQGGQCAICGEEPKQLHVDHNHTTGTVRGLLCSGCNTGIGQLRESERLLASAAAYLRKHAESAP